MLANLYPVSFLVALGALTGWYFYRDSAAKGILLRNLFFCAMTVYATSWAFGEAEWKYKFMVAGREMLILLVVPALLGIFSKNKWIFLALLLAALGGMDYFYFGKLKSSFPQPVENKGDTGVPLDPNGELLVEIKEGHSQTDLQQVIEEYGLLVSVAFSPADAATTDLDQYLVVDVPAKHEAHLPKVKNMLENHPAVAWVEANEIYPLSPLETAPLRSVPGLDKKYGLNDPGLQQLWGFEEMKVAELYGVLKNNAPKKKALIAILDTGVDAKHEDIKANFTSTKTKHDDDPAGHGTHCAGIAAAVSNNGLGVASFSQNNEYVQVTSVKVLSGSGYGTQKMIIDGILEAADAGADVLSLSLGGPSSDTRQTAYKKAVEYANKKGAIVVVAAGNSNRSAKDFAPANVAGVIAVSAIDTLLNRASFSNHINEIEMGIAAPGVSVFSTFPNGQYRSLNGTSMATPYVAGLVGLMKSLDPALTTKQAFDILKKTGRSTNQPKETGPFIQPGAAINALLGK